MGNFISKEDVSYRSLNQKDFDTIDKAYTLLEQMEVPQLYDANNPHSRIFIALADGTENDLSNPDKYTNVAKLYKELKDNFKNHPRIGFDYIEGVGTQEKFIEPGEIKQAMILYDPVLTNMIHRDFTLSNSTVSVLQMNAKDERRNLFSLTEFTNKGLSKNKNCLCVELPGSHSDIGGSYKIDGVAKVSKNMTDKYLNAITGGANFKETKISLNPKDYVHHYSAEHKIIYIDLKQRKIKNVNNPHIGSIDNKLPIKKIEAAKDHKIFFELSSIDRKKTEKFQEAAQEFFKQRDVNKPTKEKSKSKDKGFER